MTTDELTTERPVHSTDWAEAFHNYQREVEAYASVAAEYEAAAEEYHRALPEDQGDDFTPYGLHQCIAPNRNSLIVNAELRIIMRDFKERGDEGLTPDELARVRGEAARVVDNFLEWKAERAKAQEKASERYDPAEKKHDAACDRLSHARTKLLNTAAPDVEAMLFKLDLLAGYMAECDAEDAKSVGLIRDDASRLLGRA